MTSPYVLAVGTIKQGSVQMRVAPPAVYRYMLAVLRAKGHAPFIYRQAATLTLTGAEIDAELEELRSGMEDVEFWRYGS